MNKIISSTLDDLKDFPYLLTRFNKQVDIPDDLDILVYPEDFDSVVAKLVNNGYKSTSHDHALGGRIPGAQINLTKQGRIKIDLHKDFTWRCKKYIDLQTIWKNSQKNHVNPVWDAFLVMINVIFEKTYFTDDDLDIFWPHKNTIFSNQEFIQTAKKYAWEVTFHGFKSWIDKLPETRSRLLFLPFKLVIFSYTEKFNFVSLLYYLFFKTRYVLNNKLPYAQNP